MADDYWVSFWKKRGLESVGLESQTRVLRTSEQRPIGHERWQQTLTYIDKQFPVGTGATLLDLAAGNGLFSREFAGRGAAVTAVDVSPELLAELDMLAHPKIQTLCRDMRDLDFAEASFSHIFFYAGIQYLTHGEAVRLLRSCCRWLQPGGRLMIGDVPDAGLRWTFYNTPERRAVYFDNLTQGREVIGSWYERDWIRYLAQNAGYASVAVYDQPPEQIYARFRFDAFFAK